MSSSLESLIPQEEPQALLARLWSMAGPHISFLVRDQIREHVTRLLLAILMPGFGCRDEICDCHEGATSYQPLLQNGTLPYLLADAMGNCKVDRWCSWCAVNISPSGETLHGISSRLDRDVVKELKKKVRETDPDDQSFRDVCMQIDLVKKELWRLLISRPTLRNFMAAQARPCQLGADLSVTPAWVLDVAVENYFGIVFSFIAHAMLGSEGWIKLEYLLNDMFRRGVFEPHAFPLIVHGDCTVIVL